MFTKSDIEKYFLAEKQEGLFLMLIGFGALLLALIFFFGLKNIVYKGAAITLVTWGLLLGLVGFTVYNGSDQDRIRTVYAYDMNPGDLKEREIPRMKKVINNFLIYRYIETILSLIGMGIFLYFNDRQALGFWKGAGVSLLIMGIITLSSDYLAANRGKLYLQGLESWAAGK